MYVRDPDPSKMTGSCGFFNSETFISPPSLRGHTVCLTGRAALDLAGAHSGPPPGVLGTYAGAAH